jgi:signal peptidase I
VLEVFSECDFVMHNGDGGRESRMDYMGLQVYSDAYRDVAPSRIERCRGGGFQSQLLRGYRLRPVSERDRYSDSKATFRKVAFVVLLAVFSVYIIRGFFFETFYIPSASMEPLLQVDDHILVSKASYGVRLTNGTRLATPERGDVVVFKRSDDPSTQEDESSRAMVKRVVAVPGDIVAVRGDDVQVLSSLSEKLAGKLQHASKKATVYTIPENAVFVVGDNREVSYDSRYWREPFVSFEQIIGKVALVY